MDPELLLLDVDPELLLLDVDPELLLLDVDPELPLLDVDPELLDVDPLAPDELELLLLAPPSVSGGVNVLPPLHAARRPIPERAATRAIEGVFVMPVQFATAIPQTDVATRSRKAGCSARGTRAIHVSPVTTCCTTRHTLRRGRPTDGPARRVLTSGPVGELRAALFGACADVLRLGAPSLETTCPFDPDNPPDATIRSPYLAPRRSSPRSLRSV